ncbi:MAG: sigma-54-dependent Fis family transcriptional regulator [Deltaproteobacteria bacterium]|nr:sigma-54-dependent Fis family transcriptional regulator [Deltaproteobacteria bacterium]MBW2362801.1 sigma-54-dependent Fis family transcriptional regulator [Deltaproteobacteria bacterium]
MSGKARILVVDDERSMQEFLDIFFRSEGYDVVTAGDVATGRLHLENDAFDIVISDIQMPDGSGLDLLQAAHELAPETLVVMITAFASTETAITAMKQGAYDYVTKPFQVDEIRLVVENALEKKLLTSENRRLRSELRGRHRAIVGSSGAMQAVYDLVAQVADTKANVLITGESGTGKEMVARAIQQGGQRRENPFVTVNCAAIPENLLESELFGHVKGAFTGAVQSKAGLFEMANSGTLFLDEVGDLPPALQVKLLRVIQEKTFRRVGATSDQRSDVRIVAATNRRLEEEVEAGRFREDLYYRLNVIEIRLPPLRERRDDIALLVDHFIKKYAGEFGREVTSCSDAALAKLMKYRFPGNVRELENVVERAVALARGPVIDVESLPPTLMNPSSGPRAERLTEEGVDLDALTAEYERGWLLEALRATGGVKKKAAQLLGISFRSFRYRCEKLGLDSPGPADPA